MQRMWIRFPPASRCFCVLWLTLAGVGCGDRSVDREVTSQDAVTSQSEAIPRSEVTPPSVDPPSGPGAMAPHLALSSSGVWLTWLEPDTSQAERAFRLRMAGWDGESWSAARELAAGDRFFANWTDVPSVAEAPDGSLVAHWLEKLGPDTYAYGIQLTGSTDGGATWDRLGLLHDDDLPVEHGFVSFVSLPDGLRAFWLDGRQTGGDPPGPMQLRTTHLVGSGASGLRPEPSTLIDDRICDCCETDAAMTSQGPIVVYRDRGETEIRDISVVRAVGDGWSAPTTIADDGWEIHACPTNGPAVAAQGDSVAVAWFSAVAGEPRVKVAFSADAGHSFDEPILIDDSGPFGRVGVALDSAGRAWVSWLAELEEHGELRLRRVASSGEMGDTEIVTETTTSRSAGVPRMVRLGDRLVLVWVEDREPSRLRMAQRAIG